MLLGSIGVVGVIDRELADVLLAVAARGRRVIVITPASRAAAGQGEDTHQDRDPLHGGRFYSASDARCRADHEGLFPEAKEEDESGVGPRRGRRRWHRGPGRVRRAANRVGRGG